MGTVPNLVTGVWVGGEERSIHFSSISYGQGAVMSLPIWALYMKKNYANDELGISKEAFEEPEEMSINIDCSKEQEDEEQEKIDTEDDLDDLDF